MIIKINKGLNIPIKGQPQQEIDSKPIIYKTIGINSRDYNGMKPALKVKEGDVVKIGSPLFECKKTEGVLYTAQAGGVVKEINRGDRRAFLSLVIEVAQNEEFHSFSNYKTADVAAYSSDDARNLLVESGLWTAFRTRPFSKVPAPSSEYPQSIFVTAFNSSPLAEDAALIIKNSQADFNQGLQVLAHFATKTVFVCESDKDKSYTDLSNSKVKAAKFQGPHPAGLVGTHMHFLDPVSSKKVAWHIGYQDVIALGRLFATGRLNTERIVALAGPCVKNPRLLKTRLGANILDLVKDEVIPGDNRIISGSPLSGDTITEGPLSYLGRYTNQISVLTEERARVLLGWHDPGFNKFSVKRTFLGWLSPDKSYNLGTSSHGGLRAIVPSGAFERVMPLDILPVPLLKALVIKDEDLAQDLGALELDEEDLSLMTFACSGKIDYGPYLREVLKVIEKEG